MDAGESASASASASAEDCAAKNWGRDPGAEDKWVESGRIDAAPAGQRRPEDADADASQATQGTTASAVIRRSLAGEERYKNARVRSAAAGDILERIREERQILYEIAKAELEVEAQKLRMFDKVAREISRGEAREVRIGEVLDRLGPAISADRGEAIALTAGLAASTQQERHVQLQLRDQQQRQQQQQHEALRASQVCIENWDWDDHREQIRIDFGGDVGADALASPGTIAIFSARLLHNAAQDRNRLVVDFSSRDAARHQEFARARRAAAAREAVISQESGDSQEEGAPAVQRQHQQPVLPASPLGDSRHEHGIAPAVPIAGPAVKGDELETPASKKCNKASRTVRLSPSQKTPAAVSNPPAKRRGTRDGASDPTATAAVSGREDEQQEEETENAERAQASFTSVSTFGSTRERMLSAFLQREGFTLAQVEPPFTIDALVRPGHEYVDAKSRHKTDYFYVDTDLEIALRRFPSLHQKFEDLMAAGATSLQEPPDLAAGSSGAQDPALASSSQRTASTHEGGLEHASDSDSGESVHATQVAVAQSQDRAARSLLLGSLGPLKAQDFVDYLVGRGWSLANVPGPQTARGRRRRQKAVLIKPRHKLGASSVEKHDFLARDSEADLRDFVLGEEARADGFVRMMLERQTSKKRGLFSVSVSPSHLQSFFAQQRPDTEPSARKRDPAAAEVRSVCDMVQDMLDDEDDDLEPTTAPKTVAPQATTSGKKAKAARKRPRLASDDTSSDPAALAGNAPGQRPIPAARGSSEPQMQSGQVLLTTLSSEGSLASKLDGISQATSSNAPESARRGAMQSAADASGKKRVRYAETQTVSAAETGRSAVSSKRTTRAAVRASSSTSSHSHTDKVGRGPGAKPSDKDSLGPAIDFTRKTQATPTHQEMLRMVACGASAWVASPSEAYLGIRQERRDPTAARELYVCPVCYTWAVDDLVADTEQTRFSSSAECVLPDPVEVFRHGGDLVGAAGMCFTSRERVVKHLARSHKVDFAKTLKGAGRVVDRHRLYSLSSGGDGLINAYVRQLVGGRFSPKISIQEYFESKSRTQLVSRVSGILKRSMQRALVFPECRYRAQSEIVWDSLMEPYDRLSHVLPLSKSKAAPQRDRKNSGQAYVSRDAWARDGETMFLLCGRYAQKSFRTVHIEDLPYLSFWADHVERAGEGSCLQNHAKLARWYCEEPARALDDGGADGEEDRKAPHQDAWTRYGKTHKVRLNHGLAEMSFWDAFVKYPMLCVSLKMKMNPPAAVAAFCNWLHRSDAHSIEAGWNSSQ